ncbi:HpcH/HpaI aldolase/citrate lyase family protein [Clostridiaceae bacterium 35-E11]
MQYFHYLTKQEKEKIFYTAPQAFDRDSHKDILAYALGATLYMPSTKENIAQDILSKKHPSLMSMVMCLEDAIGDDRVEEGEQMVLQQLKQLSIAVRNGEIDYQDIPLMFLRIRDAGQMLRISERAQDGLHLLTGFVFPKFSLKNGITFFQALKQINKSLKKPMYGMPILETKDILYKETRLESLNYIHHILKQYDDLVLNIRVGATDFCSLFGIRRSYSMTIYDITVIRDCIGDILNYFTRVERGYVVSAPVWEYFSNGERVLKPQLRQSPFEEIYGPAGRKIRAELLSKYIDGLIREVLLDQANGFMGKTIIHPSHILPVQALNVVSHEQYMDATSIMDNNNGKVGVVKSHYDNKMNEIKPHLSWAEKIMIKSKIYGVYHEKQNFTSLLTKKVYI